MICFWSTNKVQCLGLARWIKSFPRKQPVDRAQIKTVTLRFPSGANQQTPLRLFFRADLTRQLRTAVAFWPRISGVFARTPNPSWWGPARPSNQK